MTNKNIARIAGFLYLILAITGFFGLMVVPSKIIVAGDSVATANNIMASEFLFRFGIVSNLICQTCFLFLVLVLYRLLKGVNKKQALLMLILVAVSVPIACLNTLNHVAALVLLSGADFLSGFEADKLSALAMFFLNLYDHGIFIVEIFWGLWLFPFGFLVFKSEFLPKILGVLLMIGCFGYPVESVVRLLFPSCPDVVSQIATMPSAVGEISIMLWLLIMGAKNQPSATRETF